MCSKRYNFIFWLLFSILPLRETEMKPFHKQQGKIDFKNTFRDFAICLLSKNSHQTK